MDESNVVHWTAADDFSTLFPLLDDSVQINLVDELISYMGKERLEIKEEILIKKCRLINCFLQKTTEFSEEKFCSYENLLKSSLDFVSVKSSDVFLDESSCCFIYFINDLVNVILNFGSYENLLNILLPFLNKILTNDRIEIKDFNLEYRTLVNILYSITDFKLNSNKDSFSKLNFGQIGKILVEECFVLPISVLRENIKLLQKIILVEGNNLLLTFLWDKISQVIERQLNEENKMYRSLILLCYLNTNFITKEINNSTLPLHSENLFWKLVQTGISNENQTNRKLSLCLIKKFITELEDSNISGCDLFCWKTESKIEMSKAFSHIFVLCETLEETQIHIIIPSFKDLEELINLCITKKLIHPTWLSSIYIRLFSQDSIVLIKTSISYLTSIDEYLLLNDYNYKKLFFHFFKALNNMFVFNNSDEININDSLVKWFSSFNKHPEIYREILSVLPLISWGPIPLFHVVDSLAKVPKVQAWDNRSLVLLKNFVSDALRTQTFIIRGGIQSGFVKCLVNLSKDNLNLIEIADVLSIFRRDECLKRGTEEWSICSNWIKSLIDKKDVDIFIQKFLFTYLSEKNKFLPFQSLARLLNLISDTNLIEDTKNLYIFIHSLFEQFEDCDKRIYSSEEKQNDSIKLILYILYEGDDLNDENENKNFLYQEITNKFPHVIIFFKHKFKTLSQLQQLSYVEIYLKLLTFMYEQNKLRQKYFNLLNELYNLVLNELHNDNLLHIKEFMALKIINLHFQFYSSSLTENLKIEGFSKIFKNKILYKCLIKEDTKLNSLEDKKVRGKIISSNIQMTWNCFFLLVSNLKERENKILFDSFPLDVLMAEGLESLNTGGKEAVIVLLDVFKIILNFYEDTTAIINFINVTWTMTFELRKSELFWNAITKWISMVFQEKLLKSKSLHTLILNYAEEILKLGNDIWGLVNILVRQLETISSTEPLLKYQKTILDCLLFGPLLRKDQKLEIETCNYIHSLKTEFAINKLAPMITTRSEKEVRLSALNLLFKDDSKMGYCLVSQVIQELIREDINYAKNNKRYFNDSLIHRKKNRTLQIILVLLNYIIQRTEEFEEYDVPSIIYTWMIDSLLGETQQPSIRYQLEWLYCKLCFAYPTHFKQCFWQTFNDAINERLGCAPSFICVAFHLAKSDKDEKFFESFVENILPCCMSQSFVLRLYAQVTLEKLWAHYPDQKEKYKIIIESQKKIIAQGNVLLNAQKLQNDFYFTVFDFKKHYTLQNIFWELPRLSNVSSEEWIDVEMLLKNLDIKKIGTPLGDKDEFSLAQCVAPIWINKVIEEVTSKDENIGIQRKFVPWKGMFPDEDLVESQTARKKGGLILVTSLIDKLANLGGLTRSCDVFGVKELVLGSLEYAKDKVFTSLSMTAEKHINITEVKPYNLATYLEGLKKSGYTIIGAEQTTNSTTVSKYNFPFKSALVLGNEREGIPADILLQLDVCIEIPQYGVIRSLNVHVSGAILLWEYAKQHMTKT